MKTKILFMAFSAMLMIACNNSKQQEVLKDIQLSNSKLDNQREKEVDSVVVGNLDNDQNKLATPIKAITDWDKKIIKTADIKLELKDYSKYNSNLHAKLKGYGAYIAKEEQSQYNEILQNTVVIKVPVEKFDDVLNSFNDDGITVIEKKINTEDVTGELVDGKARMEAKKQVRQQYMALLKQAKNMKDILEVQKEINAIQEEIESVNGRIDYLSHQTSYSTINLNYYQYINGVNPYNNRPTFVTKLTDAFTNGFSIISNFCIFMISIWPVLIIIVTMLFLYKRKKWYTKQTIL
jgi:hypothetical protein